VAVTFATSSLLEVAVVVLVVFLNSSSKLSAERVPEGEDPAVQVLEDRELALEVGLLALEKGDRPPLQLDELRDDLVRVESGGEPSEGDRADSESHLHPLFGPETLRV
jgi:hypothetical protein